MGWKIAISFEGTKLEDWGQGSRVSLPFTSFQFITLVLPPPQHCLRSCSSQCSFHRPTEQTSPNATDSTHTHKQGAHLFPQGWVPEAGLAWDLTYIPLVILENMRCVFRKWTVVSVSISEQFIVHKVWSRSLEPDFFFFFTMLQSMWDLALSN